MTTNPPSEVNLCKHGARQKRCWRKECPEYINHPKESPVSQSVGEKDVATQMFESMGIKVVDVTPKTATEATMDEKNEIAKQQMARRSQSVEMEEIPNNTKDLVDMTVIYPEIGDVLRESNYEFRTGDKIRKLGLTVESLLSSTLSTLVNEMEGLKTNNHGEDESDYDRQDGFNTGISAAVEVVNRLNK